jgi:type I restriction enzyme S subunit
MITVHQVQYRFKPYPAYKDSGVEWLGAIPAHWEVLAVKRRAKRIQTGTTPPTADPEYYQDGVVPWYGPGSFADDLPLQPPAKYIAEEAVRDGVARVFESGTVVIVTIGTVGKVAFMEQAGSFNQQITGVTFDGQRVDAKYGAYQLKRLEPVLRGIAPNTTLPILDQEEVGYLPFMVPPLAEQRAIAAFLDRETAKIDALVEKKERLISLLREKRTALISHVVTKGLDPTVPMKDSGVEWLGPIPAHWEVKRLKTVASIQVAKVAKKSDETTYVGLEHVESWTGRLLLDAHREVVDSVVTEFRAGDVLFGKLRPYLAKAARPDFDGVCSSELVVLRPTAQCTQTFLMYFLLNSSYIRWIDSLTYGTKMPRVSPEQVGSSAIALPPLSEQRAIATFLDRETAKIDALIAKVREAIERLKEYRTALISAAVTGKIDVREVVAP